MRFASAAPDVAEEAAQLRETKPGLESGGTGYQPVSSGYQTDETVR